MVSVGQRVHLRIAEESKYACGAQRKGRTITSTANIEGVTCFACKKTAHYRKQLDLKCAECGVSYNEKPHVKKVEWQGKWQCASAISCNRRKRKNARRALARTSGLPSATVDYPYDSGVPRTSFGPDPHTKG